jgi:hypothetical protein
VARLQSLTVCWKEELMSAIQSVEAANWSKLLHLLSGGEMDKADLAEAVLHILEAPSNPEYAYLIDLYGDDQGCHALALTSCLQDQGLLAVSDKTDELHGQISEFFADPLPPFPAWSDKRKHTTDDYFSWLDAELSQRAPASGGYELLNLDPGLDDNLYAVVVNRPDTPSILALGHSLGVRIGRLGRT